MAAEAGSFRSTPARQCIASLLFAWIDRQAMLWSGDERSVSMTAFWRWPALSVVALTSSCAPRPEAGPQPIPARPEVPVTAPAPPQPGPASAAEQDWSLLPLTSGDWTYSGEPGGSQADFGSPGERLFTMRCDFASRQILLSRQASRAGSRLTIRTTYGPRERGLSAQAGSAFPPAAVFQSSDPFLDGIAYSRGRFSIEAPGLATLVIPAWPETARVIEECRS